MFVEHLVDEVELIEANPNYAHVKFPSGRQSTVSIRDLAPIVSSQGDERVYQSVDPPVEELSAEPSTADVAEHVIPDIQDETLRRSVRVRRGPDRLGEWDIDA